MCTSLCGGVTNAVLFHFVSAVVAVDSSHVTASSSSASCSSFSSLVSGHVSTNIVVHGLSLATITGRSLDKTPSVQICTAWALACLETVEQRPCVTREIETWFCANETVIES